MIWVLCSSAPVIRNRFFSPLNCLDQLWGPPSLLFNGCWGCFAGVKWPQHDVDRSPPTGTLVNNEWTCRAVCSVCLCGEDRDKVYWLKKCFDLYGYIIAILDRVGCSNWYIYCLQWWKIVAEKYVVMGAACCMDSGI